MTLTDGVDHGEVTPGWADFLLYNVHVNWCRVLLTQYVYPISGKLIQYLASTNLSIFSLTRVSQNPVCLSCFVSVDERIRNFAQVTGIITPPSVQHFKLVCQFEYIALCEQDFSWTWIWKNIFFAVLYQFCRRVPRGLTPDSYVYRPWTRGTKSKKTFWSMNVEHIHVIQLWILVSEI